MRKGWEMKKIGDICEIKGRIGYRGYTKEDIVKKGDGAITLSPSNINGDKLNFDNCTYISWFKYEESPEIMIYEDDILFVKTGSSYGKVAIVEELPEKATINPQSVVLKEIKCQNKFLYYQLISHNFKEQVETIVGGSSIPTLSQTNLATLKIPIPPLPEQKRIVAILDEAFEAIDQAKANIVRNIQNAEELFQSKLNEIFSQRGEGWEDKALGNVCKVDRGSSPRPIKKFFTTDKSGVNWVKIGDVNENDKYVYSTKQKITKEGALKSRFVDVGDFILSNSMSYGRPYIMKIPGYIHDGWFVLRLPDDLNPDYFWQLLASPLLKKQFEYLAAGAIVKNISGDLVKKAKLPIPPIDIQYQIVEETENLSDVTQSLYELYQHKLKSLEELKKSILQKAFSGELTGGEPRFTELEDEQDAFAHATETVQQYGG